VRLACRALKADEPLPQQLEGILQNITLLANHDDADLQADLKKYLVHPNVGHFRTVLQLATDMLVAAKIAAALPGASLVVSFQQQLSLPLILPTPPLHGQPDIATRAVVLEELVLLLREVGTHGSVLTWICSQSAADVAKLLEQHEQAEQTELILPPSLRIKCAAADALWRRNIKELSRVVLRFFQLLLFRYQYLTQLENWQELPGWTQAEAERNKIPDPLVEGVVSAIPRVGPTYNFADVKEDDDSQACSKNYESPSKSRQCGTY
jgi:hypothetical protein